MSGMLGAQAAPQPQDDTPDHEPMGSQLAAQFDKTSQALKSMNDVRSGLTKLASMGTAVTPEDVIKEAGTLVGKGQDPIALAGLMADMPTNGGDALASWVAMHAAQAQQNEQQLKQAHTVVRHTLGVHSLHQLARNAAGAGGAGAPPIPGGALGQMTPKGNA